jgi:hypothetical protein
VFCTECDRRLLPTIVGIGGIQFGHGSNPVEPFDTWVDRRCMIASSVGSVRKKGGDNQKANDDGKGQAALDDRDCSACDR